MNIWETLGVPHDADRDTIRRAYARKLRVTNPEDDAEGFKILREAYESALAHVEWVTKWGDYDDDEKDGDGEDGEPGDGDEPTSSTTTIAGPDGGNVWYEISDTEARITPQWAVPDDAPPPIGEQAEFAEILAGRAAELEQLHALMAELESGLRGPWRPTDTVMEHRLNALLDAPAMGEINVRNDIESWLAELLAATIPHSDAVLQQSISAFGWNEDARNGYNHAVAQVLERLEEWRTVAALNHHSHGYHQGWKSLTGAPGNTLLWQLDALRPSVVHGVAALLGDFGAMSPGLRFSFKAASLARWQAYFAKPRLTLGIMSQVPILLYGLLELGFGFGLDTLSPTAIFAFAALLACAGPIITVQMLAPIQRRWSARYDHDRWRSHGWFFAYIAIGFLGGMLPGAWPMVLALPALAIAGWAFVVKQPPPLHREKSKYSSNLVLIAFIFSLIIMRSALSQAQGFGLICWMILFVHLRYARSKDAHDILHDLLSHLRRWIILCGLVIFSIIIGWQLAVWRTSWDPSAPAYFIGLTILTIAMPVGALQEGSRIARWISLALLSVAIFFAFAASAPKTKSTPSPPSGQVPLATNGSDGTKRGISMLDASNAEQGVAVLERDYPAFAGVRQAKPALYQAMLEKLKLFYTKQASREETNTAIVTLLDKAYRAKACDAGADLLIANQRIRLSVLHTLQTSDAQACADETDRAPDPKLLTDAQRKQQNTNMFDIISGQPVSEAQRAVGKPIPLETYFNAAAQQLRIKPAELMHRIKGEAGAPANCAARIAILTALLDDHDSRDVAATLRAKFVHQ